MNTNEQTRVPFFAPDSKIRTTIGTVVAITVAVGGASVAWTWVQADLQAHHRTISQHETRLAELEAKFERDHDVLLEIRGDIKSLMRDTRKE